VARGNDAATAAEELRAKLGAEPNAEEMIALSAARWPAELRAANNRPVDEEGTSELDEQKAQDFVGDRNVLAYAVRGPFLVVVSEDDTGFTVKQAFALDEKKAERMLPREPAPEPEAEAEVEVEEKTATGAGSRTAAKK
jgi:hypothetical protein